jgi:hypothetical protein
MEPVGALDPFAIHDVLVEPTVVAEPFAGGVFEGLRCADFVFDRHLYSLSLSLVSFAFGGQDSAIPRMTESAFTTRFAFGAA